MRESIQHLFKRLRDASRGIWLMYLDPHFRIHLKLGGLATIIAVLYRVTEVQWALLIIVIGGVLADEAMNTAEELRIDWKQSQSMDAGSLYDEDIRDIKDIAAASVLIKSVTAAIVGVIIFAPHVVHTITQVF